MAGIIPTLIAAAKPLLSKGATIIWENRNYLQLYFKTKFLKYKNMDIRFSISGLYKIIIPGTNQYLLVINRRIENQLQPVGGAYKRFGDDSLFNKWGYKPDNSKNGLDVDEKSSCDLRFMVQGKFCIDVLDWFESGNERELNPEREFREELLLTGIFNSSIFHNIQYKQIRRFSKNLVWSDFFSCYEILIFEIFELIPNEEQKKVLVKLSKQKNNISNGFAIVSCDDIEQLRLVDNKKQIARIGRHTKLLINKEF